MRAGRRSGRPEHGPNGDRNQGGRQDGPGDEPLPHQAESVGVMNVQSIQDPALQTAAIL